MLELQRIRNDKENVIAALAIKNFDAENIVNEIIELDERRRKLQKELDDNLAEANKIAKSIGLLYKEGKRDEAEKIKEKSSKLKAKNKELGAEQEQIIKMLNDKLVELPNIPHHSVPKGNSDADNEVVYEEGELPVLDQKAQMHWDLAKKYQIIDFDLGSKVTGAGFPFYRGKGARLQRALINFFLDEAVKAGYLEYQPP